MEPPNFTITVGATSEHTAAEKTEKLIFRAFVSSKMWSFLLKLLLLKGANDPLLSPHWGHCPLIPHWRQAPQTLSFYPAVLLVQKSAYTTFKHHNFLNAAATQILLTSLKNLTSQQ